MILTWKKIRVYRTGNSCARSDFLVHEAFGNGMLLF